MTTPVTDPLFDGLAAAQLWVKEVNISKGWYDEERSFGDDVALLHSEVSEMLEAYRDFGFENGLKSHVEDHDGGWDPSCPDCKPIGIGSEAADILIRLLDTCERHDIDLHGEFIRKMLFNEHRPIRHGGKKL